MCVLAHVLEEHGLATVALSSIRAFAEKTPPPRCLHCEFPLGRPLGKPGDPAYQRRVIEAAFELLKEPKGPVLVDFPDTIRDAAEHPLEVDLPSFESGDDPAPVAEAVAIRPMYDRHRERYGRTNVGRLADADGLPELIRSFVAIANGTPWRDAAVPYNNLLEATKDIMSYYEEAAAATLDAVPEARAAESWFFRNTAAGALLKQAQAKLKAAEYPAAAYIVPATQQG